MFNLYIADQWPSWLIFTILAALFTLSIEIGYRMGKFRRRSLDSPETIQPSGIVGAVIALLAFLVAFTFSMAGTQFSVRKQLVLQEANAIGTAYLRADLLPERQRLKTKALLREYVAVRLKTTQLNPKGVKEALEQTATIQDQLWSQAVELKDSHSSSITIGLFIESLNEIFDLHTERFSATFRNRIPKGIRLTLFCIALVSVLLRGYMDGLLGKMRNIFATTMMILAFSVVLVLIVDLDRPAFTDRRLLDTSQQALIDLYNDMKQQ